MQTPAGVALFAIYLPRARLKLSHPNLPVMPRIPRFALPLLLFTMSFLLHFSCKNAEPPTVITGKVTNKKSGAPIEGVTLECEGYTGKIGNETSKDFTTKSDHLGNYNIVAPNEYRLGFYRAFAVGYLTKVQPASPVPISIGDSNRVDIALIPLDGFLRLNVRKIGNQPDSIYVSLSSPTTVAAGLGTKNIEKYPLILHAGEAYAELFSFPSEENISLYWDFKPFTVPNAVHKSAIYLPEKDTTDFLIEY